MPSQGPHSLFSQVDTPPAATLPDGWESPTPELCQNSCNGHPLPCAHAANDLRESRRCQRGTSDAPTQLVKRDATPVLCASGRAVLQLLRRGDGARAPTSGELARWIGARDYVRWTRLTRFIAETYPDVFAPKWSFGGRKHGWPRRPRGRVKPRPDPAAPPGSSLAAPADLASNRVRTVSRGGDCTALLPQGLGIVQRRSRSATHSCSELGGSLPDAVAMVSSGKDFAP